MSIFGTAKEFFGLGPYNEDEAYYDDSRYPESGSTAYGRGAESHGEPARAYTDAAPRSDYGSYRSAPARDFAPAIVSAAPRTYNDAKEIGEPFRAGDAVIMDLTDLDASDAKRLIDFAAGLCFALRGKMHNLSRGLDTDRRVFAIAPENAPFGAAELERAAHLR
ncbi:cell division protein SepF [uncultured Corynebacterium sp.]|uniref:cell division protein SepF n=1 Tax=uncultured Corynebacterium sp. TaxID=159447 RepID=UPI0025954CCA|nr:cell division protein SepF [uncultured Corynebacterium sp.]